MCIICGAVPRVTGVAEAAAAGDDPSSPINGGPHPPFSPWPHVTPPRLATHAASVPTANERLNIHAERFHLSAVPCRAVDHRFDLPLRQYAGRFSLYFFTHYPDTQMFIFELEWQSCYKVSFLIAMDTDKRKAAYTGDIRSATYQLESGSLRIIKKSFPDT